MTLGMDQGSNPLAMASGSAKALVKGLAVLDLLAAHPAGLRLTDVVQKSGVPKGTALRLLDALVSSNAVSIEDSATYRLGARCATWGSAFLESVDIRRIARDTLVDLAELSGETCHLGIREGYRVLYIDKIDGTHSIRMVSRVGGTNPLYCTGLGKALLAYQPDEIIEVAEGVLERRTENTITDAVMLQRELALIRQRGYAVDDVENEEGVRCVGAPVFDHTDRVVASISIAGPAYRMTRERIRMLGPRIRDAAEELSGRLGYAKGESDTGLMRQKGRSLDNG